MAFHEEPKDLKLTFRRQTAMEAFEALEGHNTFAF